MTSEQQVVEEVFEGFPSLDEKELAALAGWLSTGAPLGFFAPLGTCGGMSGVEGCSWAPPRRPVEPRYRPSLSSLSCTPDPSLPRR